MVRCMRSALEDAETDPDEIDYINAHATGTLQGDAAEAGAVAEIFGQKTPVSSLKGYIGHTLGASGAIELTASLKMMENKLIIPGLNLETPADECSAVMHPEKPIPQNISAFIKNSFAFGGVNASIVCRAL